MSNPFLPFARPGSVPPRNDDGKFYCHVCGSFYLTRSAQFKTCHEVCKYTRLMEETFLVEEGVTALVFLSNT